MSKLKAIGSLGWWVVSCGAVAAAAQPSLTQDTPASSTSAETSTHVEPLTQPTDPTGPAPESAAADPLTVSINGWFEHTFRTDLDDEAGDVAISRTGAGVSLSSAMGDEGRARWFLPFNWEWSHYDFSDAGSLIDGPTADEPFEDGHIFTLAPSLAYVFDEHWSARGGVILESAMETGADFGDSLTIGGLVAARYAFSREFAFTFGMIVKSRLEDSVLAIPIIGAEWQVNERLRVSSAGAGPSGAAARGPGIGLYYSATESLTLSAGVNYEFREYRLEQRDDDSSEGVFADQRVNLVVGLEWHVAEQITLGLTGGVAVWQEYEFQDDDGDTLDDVNADPTGVLGVSASIRF